MTDLATFLLARIAEREAEARHVAQVGSCEPAYRPAEVLAECEAKRGAIEAAWGDHLQIEGEWGSCRGRATLEAANDHPAVVRYLALPYADHAEFRQEWRP